MCVFKAALAVVLWGVRRDRLLPDAPMPGGSARSAAVAAAFLVLALPVTDEIGFALAAAVIGVQSGGPAAGARGGCH